MNKPRENEQLTLDLGTEIADALILARDVVAKHNWKYATHYITEDQHGRFWFETRTRDPVETEWDCWFQVPSVDALIAIYEAELADLHSSVNQDLRDLLEFHRSMKK